MCRTTSGESTLTALPATSRCPTSEVSRTLVSQPARPAPPSGRRGPARARRRSRGWAATRRAAARRRPAARRRSATSSSHGDVGLADVQLLGQPLLVADAEPAAAQQPGRLLLQGGEQLGRPGRRPPARRRRPAGRRRRGRVRSEPARVAAAAGPSGRSPRSGRPISRGSSTLSASIRASSPRLQQAAGRARATRPGCRAGGRPGGRRTAARARRARRAPGRPATAGRSRRERQPQVGGPAAEPGRVAHRAAHRLGGVQLVVAPEQGAGGQRLHGGVDHRRPARRAAARAARPGGTPSVGESSTASSTCSVAASSSSSARSTETGTASRVARADDVGGGGARDVGPGHQQGAQLLVGAGAQPGGERGGLVRRHPVHVTSAHRGAAPAPGDDWPATCSGLGG